MSETKYDVVGIGNAIVDVIAHTDDQFLTRHDLVKGSMALVDEARAQLIYDTMGPAMEISGGSAANTIAGIASLGGCGAYIGKVKDDQLGEVFRHDIRAIGVTFDTEPASDGPQTARSFILVTPDAQRTMNTYLGACVNLGPEDVDPEIIAASSITYLEGYLWDPPGAKDAFRKAVKIAHDAGRKVALTLSDSFCVGRYREEFLDLAENAVDILFANDDEICSLYQVDDFDEALQHVRGHCDIAALTRSEHGSVVVSGDEVHVIDAVAIDHLEDATGAGDLYAAGFLFGLTHGRDLATCAQLGSIAASEVIGHLGARPQTPLATLIKSAFSDVG
ncbi:MAG: adenosine kinase [Proteobacteria bacterium]|nr:adenosine kinase [Pseudomonadota bacterium]